MSSVLSMPQALRLALLALAFSQPILAQSNDTVASPALARPPASSSTPASPSSRPSITTSTSTSEIDSTITLTSTSTTFLTVTPSSTSRSTSTSTLTITSPATCPLDCHVGAEKTQFYWLKINSFTTTITAATKLIIINDDTGTTSTSLIFNDLPDGYTLPPMNEQGTQTWPISYTLPNGSPTQTVLTFPQEFTQYPLGYTWTGTFPLEEAGEEPECLTGDGTKVTSYGSYSTDAQTAPAATLSGDNGLTWSSVEERIFEPAYPSLLPNDPVLQSCTPANGVAPIGANPTASFLTATSTTRISGATNGGGGGTTNQPAPTPTPTQPTAEPITQPTPPANTPPANTPPANTPPANTPPANTPPANTPTPPANTPPANTPPANTPAPAPGTTAAAPPPNNPAPALGTTQAAAPAPANPAPSPNTPSAVQPAPAPSPTVVGGQTISLVAPAPAAPSPATPSQATGGVVPAPAPSPATGGVAPAPATPSPAADTPAASPAPPAVAVGGTTLQVGSTVVLGSGTTAQTVALNTNSAGAPVIVVGSSSATLSTLPSPVSTSDVGDIIAGGLGETRTSSSASSTGSGPTQQSDNAGSTVTSSYTWSVLFAMVAAFVRG